MPTVSDRGAEGILITYNMKPSKQSIITIAYKFLLLSSSSAAGVLYLLVSGGHTQIGIRSCPQQTIQYNIRISVFIGAIYFYGNSIRFELWAKY